MHQHAQLTYLVDVLAVDFEIVDRLSDARKRYRQNHCHPTLALKRFALDQFTQRDPVLAVN
jgi:hypothetical protein